MIRSLLLLIPAAVLAACTGGNGRPIELTIEGGAGKTVHFDRFESNRPFHVDSVKLDGQGKGTLHVPKMPLDFYRIALGEEQLIVALDSAETLTVVAKIGELATPSTLTGSKHTDALQEFADKAQAFEEERSQLRGRINAQPENTEAVQQFNRLNQEFYATCKQFAQEHAGSPVALSAVTKLDMQQEMAAYKLVRDELRKTMPRSGFFASFRDQVDRVEQQEIAMRMQEEEAKRLSNLLPVGSEAPEIRQATPDGGTFALSQLRGKVVLIDFWASWCKPCRIENPNVKRVYERFASKGFEVLGVSLDRAHEPWVAAIQQDGLPWKHVSDLGFWNNAAAQEYGVSSIPFTVLVDRDGKIIEKNLRGKMLEIRLEELLGS